MDDGIANVDAGRKRSKRVPRKIEKSCGRSMKAAESQMPLKDKIVDRRVTEGPERSEKLDWIEELIMTEDSWCRYGSHERLSIASFLGRGSEKQVKKVGASYLRMVRGGGNTRRE
jgi:hypothetical protein